MIKHPDEVFVTDALSVIKDTDAELYSTMIASDWDLRTARSPEEMTADMDAEDTTFTVEVFPHVFGVTGHSESSFDGVTYLQVPYITEVAAEKDMPLDQFAADVIVHEFRHYQDGLQYGGSSELPAYTEGTKFACQSGIKYTVCEFAHDALRREQQGVFMRMLFG